MFYIDMYEETAVSYDEKNYALNISLPWISGSIYWPMNVHAGMKVTRNFMEDIFNRNELVPNNQLPYLPFCYARPRHQDNIPGKEYTETPFEHTASISQLLNLIEYGFHLNQDLWVAFPKNWSWAITEVTSRSKVEGTDQFDPISIYTCIRRFRNMLYDYRLHAHTLSQSLLEQLNKNSPGFFDAVIQILCQSFYITSHCVDSLSPGLNRNEYAAGKLENYIREENGHHKLIYDTLKELGKADITEIDYFPETHAIMKLLKYAATYFPVAFCCLISGFEQAGQFDSDPLADMIMQSSKPQAAKGILTHFKINKSGNHADVGLELIKDLPACSLNELVAAVRLTELLTILFESIGFNTLKHMQHGGAIVE